jgi:hypothetical protein
MTVTKDTTLMGIEYDTVLGYLDASIGSYHEAIRRLNTIPVQPMPEENDAIREARDQLISMFVAARETKIALYRAYIRTNEPKLSTVEVMA